MKSNTNWQKKSTDMGLESSPKSEKKKEFPLSTIQLIMSLTAKKKNTTKTQNLPRSRITAVRNFLAKKKSKSTRKSSGLSGHQNFSDSRENPPCPKKVFLTL